MSITFRCSRGHVNHVIRLTTDRMANCEACGQTVFITKPIHNSRTPLAILAVIGLSVVITLGGLFAFAIVSSRSQAIPIAKTSNLEVSKPIPPISEPASKLPPVPVAAAPEIPDPSPHPVDPPVTPLDPSKREGVLRPAVVEPAGRYKFGELFGQDVTITRRSAFRMLGADSIQSAQYSIGSRIAITKVNADGSVTAEQTILTARLVDADADIKADLAAALEKSKGAKFELLVSPTGEVVAIQGIADPIQVKAGKEGVGESLRMWSILDADAWKELAGLTFFQPDKPLKSGAKWTKPVTHDWGTLGRWKGKTTYVARGTFPGKPPTDRIDYGNELYYAPPAADAGRDSPVKIGKVEFRIQTAAGAILYDLATKRSRTAEETFHVRGQLQVAFAGTDLVIEMEERQYFKLTFTEPGDRNLVGKPFPR